MKHEKIVFFATLIFSALAASSCSDDSSEEPAADAFFQPEAEIGGLGSYPSDLGCYGDGVFVVDYSNNAVHRVDLAAKTVENAYVDLGQNAGPYSVYADADAIYVASQGVAQVLRVAHADKKQTVIFAAPDVVAPTDVVTVEGTVFVADSEYDYVDSSKTGGKILALTPDGKVISHATSTQNPVNLQMIGSGEEALLVAANAGVILWSADFSTQTPPEKSCIDVWKVSDFLNDPASVPRTFCVANASIGRMAVAGGALYLGDALAPRVFSIDVDALSGAVSGELVPIELLGGAGTTVTTPVAIPSKDRPVVLDFANDAIHLSTETGGPVYSLTSSKAAVKKPIDACFNADRRELVVLNSAAGSVEILNVTAP